jgi:hypothetical protein
MLEKRGRLRLPVNGEEITVPSAAHLKCPKCHEMVLRSQDARRLGEDAIAIYRRKHGLLSADQLRASDCGPAAPTAIALVARVARPLFTVAQVSPLSSDRRTPPAIVAI